MRFFSFLFLLLFAGIIGGFIWQNHQEVTLTFFRYEVTTSIPIVIGTAFVLGMLSGWSIVGMLSRSVGRTAEMFNRRRTYA